MSNPHHDLQKLEQYCWPFSSLYNRSNDLIGMKRLAIWLIFLPAVIFSRGMLANNTERSEIEGSPPILSSWSRLYAFVLILHVILIVGFYLLTVAYS